LLLAPVEPLDTMSVDITPIAQTEIAAREFVVQLQELQEDHRLDRKPEAVSFETQPRDRKEELVDEK
jgi:hypothetical protein